LFAGGTTVVIEPKPTRDHTERVLKGMGANLGVDGPEISVDGSSGAAVTLKAGTWRVPGDFSSAAFWLTAAAVREGSEVSVEGVGVNPRRTAFLDVLGRMGAEVEVQPAQDDNGEPSGTITVRGAGLRATEVCGEEVPNLIDELPLVAVAGAMAEGDTVIGDAGELRVKESDRIAAMAEVLRAFDVEAEEHPDGMRIRGNRRLGQAGVVESRGDHRVAMAASVLACCAAGPTEIRDVACVATSYPGFRQDLERLSD